MLPPVERSQAEIQEGEMPFGMKHRLEKSEREIYEIKGYVLFNPVCARPGKPFRSQHWSPIEIPRPVALEVEYLLGLGISVRPGKWGAWRVADRRYDKFLRERILSDEELRAKAEQVRFRRATGAP